MLLEAAVADAYAIPFEFVQNPGEHGLVNDLHTYQQPPRYDDLKPSQYTDDTLRSIATALVVIEDNGSSVFDPSAYVKALQEGDWNGEHGGRLTGSERIADRAPRARAGVPRAP